MAAMPLRRDGDSEHGVVFNMTLSGNPVWSAIYSIQVQVGQSNQTISLSVDTGSSDLWIATKDCSTSECSKSHTTLYDPSNAAQTGQSTQLNYLRGQVNGPIVWDSITVGPYSIPNQALVAANSVIDENLSPDFVGLLGLALAPTSAIAKLIPPGESDAPDGATVQQNIYGITPVDTAPARHFIGITLERQDPFVVPSLLAIGKHPADSIPNFDESKIEFLDLVSSSVGDTYWRVPIGSITAWVNETARPITLPRSVVPVSAAPVAIMDTGGSPILATRDIANAIYGAFDITPAADGNYYLPCTTPMNLTIGLGDLPPIPIHPLDLTNLPATLSPGDSTTTCVGLIQAHDQLNNLGDMVLGVTFMRNVYTVLSSEPRGSDPSFINPKLGVIPLTNATQAMDEFHRVRVLGQTANSGSSNMPARTTDGRKISVGLIVLFAIVGFFVLCGALFGLRWFCLRKQFKNEDAEDAYEGDAEIPPKKEDTELQQAPFLVGYEKDESRQPSISYSSTRGSDHTRIDEFGIISKPDRSSSRSRSPTKKDAPRPSAGEDYFNDWQGNTLTAQTQTTPSSVTPAGPTTPAVEHGDQLITSQIHDSTGSEEDSGMAGVGSRNSIVSVGPTIRPVPRHRLTQDGSLGSPRPWTTVEVGSKFDVDFARSMFDGLVPGPNMQVKDLVRGRAGSIAEDGVMVSTMVRELPPTPLEVEDETPTTPTVSSGGRVRTNSEGQLFPTHTSQPSGGIETPLLASSEPRV